MTVSEWGFSDTQYVAEMMIPTCSRDRLSLHCDMQANSQWELKIYLKQQTNEGEAFKF